MMQADHSTGTITPALTAPEPYRRENRTIGLITAFAACLAAAILFTKLLGYWQPVGNRHPIVGKKLEVVNLAPLTGALAPITQGDLDGGLWMIHFWGTWCEPCVAEFPQYMALYGRYQADKRVHILMVSVPGGEGNLSELRANTQAFLDQRKTTLPTYFDEDRKTERALNALLNEPMGFPTTVIVDGQGVIRACWLGSYPNMGAEIEAALKRLIPLMSA